MGSPYARCFTQPPHVKYFSISAFCTGNLGPWPRVMAVWTQCFQLCCVHSILISFLLIKSIFTWPFMVLQSTSVYVIRPQKLPLLDEGNSLPYLLPLRTRMRLEAGARQRFRPTRNSHRLPTAIRPTQRSQKNSQVSRTMSSLYCRVNPWIRSPRLCCSSQKHWVTTGDVFPAGTTPWRADPVTPWSWGPRKQSSVWSDLYVAIGMGLEKKEKTQRLQSAKLPHPRPQPRSHGNLLPARSHTGPVITVTALSRNNVAFQIVRRGQWIHKLNWWLGTEAQAAKTKRLVLSGPGLVLSW